MRLVINSTELNSSFSNGATSCEGMEMMQMNDELCLVDLFDEEPSCHESYTELNSSISLADVDRPHRIGYNGTPARRKFSLTEMFSQSFRFAKEPEEKTQRRVSFGDVQKSPKTYTLSSRAKRSMWYNEDELDDMRDHAARVVDKEIPMDESTDCWRGLERYLEADRSIKNEETNFILLEHIHSMRYSGMNDSFDIESLANSLNENSVRAGEMQAAQDSAEAYMIYLETMEPEQVNQFF